MIIDSNFPRHIMAEEGQLLYRRDGVIVGNDHLLSEVDFFDGHELDEPYMEQVEDFRDITLEEIEDMENHIPEVVKVRKLEEITNYDKSPEVNRFFVNDIPMWIDKATRVGLVNSTTMLKAVGRETVTLWQDSFNIVLPCDALLQMLAAIEIYAFDCYNVTAQHLAEVNAMDENELMEEIRAYDVTVGYPEQLHFNIG